MTAQKPAIVFIPGAWHRPKHYAPLLDCLSTAGYEVHAVTTKSVGAPVPVRNLEPDVIATAEVVAPLANQGKDVLVIGHSYGGVVATEALGPWGKKAREARGKKGGVTGIIYLTAFMLGEGQSLFDAVGGESQEVFLVNDEGFVWLKDDYVKPMFFNDIEDKQAAETMATLESHSVETFRVPVTRIAWKDIPVLYIYCEKDVALPIENQRAMVAKAEKITKIATASLETGHSPFLNAPEHTAEIIRKWAVEAL